MPKTPPDGFELFPADNTFNDALSPLYLKFGPEGTEWGLYIEPKHLNPIGICHGGVYMTLMDFALSSAVCHMAGKFMGMPTISMNMDFLAPAKEGEWIVAIVDGLKLTNTMGFSQGLIKNEKGDILMRASGSFKLPRNIDEAEGILLADILKLKGLDSQ